MAGPEQAVTSLCYPAEWLLGISKSRRLSVRESKEVSRSILQMAGISDFRFHDLQHTFASWYMMNGGDLYELAKILGNSNIKMTERYAKLAKKHRAGTGSTAREI